MGQPALYAERDGGNPLMRSGKPLAVLAYVALAPGGTVSRDRVAELFWRAGTPQDARHSLSQALYRLRSATQGVDLLVLQEGDLVVSDRVRMDCVEGEKAIEADDLSRARMLLAGEFLGGFSVPESREFREWVETQRCRFDSLRTTAMHSLANQLLKEGQPEQALAVAEELAEQNPFDDAPVRLAMSSLAAAGRYATATARYAAHVQFLEAEGEEPGEELQDFATDLARYVRARRVAEEQELPFVGRSSQWAVVETAWLGAERGRCTTVLIEGSAGLGKTRLLRELDRRADTSQGLVLFAKCYEPEQSVPYSAVGDALSGMLGHQALEEVNRQWLAESARILPGLHEQFPDLPTSTPSEGSQAARRRLHEAIARLLEILAARTPTLLVIDDIHWADPPSLELLHTLSHRLRNVGVLIVASYRPAELGPMARRYARSLCSSGLAELISLQPLDEVDVRELLQEIARFEDPGLLAGLATQLRRQSGGNPLFLTELLDTLDRQRVLYVQEGVWVLGGDESIRGLPQTIGKMLTDRLDTLVPWMRACAEVAAVANHELPIEVLARCLDISEPRAELALSVLEEERLVRRTSIAAFDLIHDELRRLIYQGIPDERRRALHAAVGSALEALGEAKRPGGAARLVFHFDQANDPLRARKYALSAAEEASALSAYEAAQQHLDMAAAHAPRALPPSSVRTPGRGSKGPGLSRIPGQWVAALVVSALLVGSGITAVVTTRSRAFGRPAARTPDYRQGTLYLGPYAGNPTVRLAWPEYPDSLASTEFLDAPPQGLLPSLVSVPSSEGGETHAKVGRVQGGDTVLLTAGPTDDGIGGWSPDGRYVLLIRGWRTSDARFVSKLHLLEPSSGRLRQLTDTRYQDEAPAWSPLGTQIAFRRDSTDVSTLWLMDADGGRPQNLTERFDLPRSRSTSAFAPDGQRLAVGFESAPEHPGGIYLLELDKNVGRLRLAMPSSQPKSLIWSPDGEWLVYAVYRESTEELWRLPVEGGGAPTLVANIPVGDRGYLRFVAWTDGHDRYLDDLTIAPSNGRLQSGQGIQLTATARDQAGGIIPAVLRWSVRDEEVARVDDQGFVVARLPGSTTVVGTAGGFRADTVSLVVVAASVDTLLVEDWGAGLDTVRWEPFGQPRPVVQRLERQGRSVFLNNGDYNHGSGVISRESFEASRFGLTVETSAHLHFTGDPWQYWQLGLVLGEPRLLAGVELSYLDVDFSVMGPNPTQANTDWTCGLRPVPPVPTRDREWFPISIQLRPDGVMECFLDGRLLGRDRLGRDLDQNVHVVLRGSSVGTEVYHGPVVVTRGLRR